MAVIGGGAVLWTLTRWGVRYGGPGMSVATRAIRRKSAGKGWTPLAVTRWRERMSWVVVG